MGFPHAITMSKGAAIMEDHESGLYITEIVKRLYHSEQMKKQFPDPKERLRHIFEK